MGSYVLEIMILFPAHMDCIPFPTYFSSNTPNFKFCICNERRSTQGFSEL